MKAISLWQPHASLWCSPRKLHETRHWPTAHRGWLLVHAAKRFVKAHGPELRAILKAEFGECWYSDLPTGALIGVVKLVACNSTDGLAVADDDRQCGDFSSGRFAWQRAEYRRFEAPIPYIGHQGFFDVPNTALPEPYRSGWVA